MIHLYRVLNLVFIPFFILFIPFSKKQRAWFKRKSNLRKSNLKSIWIHASSGEFEHAKSIIRKLKNKYSYKKIVVTYSSPSYQYAVESHKGIDMYAAYPLDLKVKVHELIKTINPEVVLFARTDLWPELMHQLKIKKIPSLVFARMEKSKLGFFKKLVYKLTYLKSSHISFVNKKDEDNFLKHLKHPSTSADSDPRIDEVLFRKSKIAKDIAPLDKCMVLGSIWKKDFDQIKQSLIKNLKAKSIKKIIIAPHELNEGLICEIEDYFSDFKPKRHSRDNEFNADVVILDKMGLLFETYALAEFAFVGGGFKKKVHSVLEPLSFGIPVVIGPNYRNNREAKVFSKEPYKYVFPIENGLNPDSVFQEALHANFKDEALREIETRSGATEKIIGLIKPYLSEI